MPATLAREAESGAIETVITALPDLYGRLVGKRITAGFYLAEIAAHGMHVCDYLLACDMEMDPTPGYAFTSWAKGYGDLRALPDPATPAARGLARSQRDRDLRRARGRARRRDRGGAALDPEAPARAARRARAPPARWAASSSSSCSATTTARRAPRATAGSITRAATSRTITCSRARSPSRSSARSAGACDASAIPVEFSKGEWGPGQHELNLRFAAALEMADRHVIYKQAAKEIAAAAGASLTFMAKFDEKLAGSSLHIHTSLWSPDGKPLFAERGEPLAGTPVHAPPLFRWFLGGLLEHARELGWFFAPNPNSYKRYRAGTFAPTGIAWSYDNRTAGFRIVGRRPVAARRVPHPRRRRESLSRLRGAAGRRPRRHRAQARSRAGVRGRRLRRDRTCPTCRARCTRRSASSRRAPSRAAPSATP